MNLKIVQTAIELIAKKGYPWKDNNLSGFAQAFAKDELNIVYTTQTFKIQMSYQVVKDDLKVFSGQAYGAKIMKKNVVF